MHKNEILSNGHDSRGGGHTYLHQDDLPWIIPTY